MKPTARQARLFHFVPLAAICLVACALGASFAQTPPLTCTVSAGGNPPLIRGEGLSELVGDVVVICNGGTPTAAGAAIPLHTITVSLNTNSTGRMVGANSLSEALLLIDEPHSISNPNTPLYVCAGGLSPCPMTGIGPNPGLNPNTGVYAGPYDGTPGRYNVFQGRQVAPNRVAFVSVPFDAPGVTSTRTLRITNIRANANQVGVSATPSPSAVTEFIAFSGSSPVPVSNPQATVAFVVPGMNGASGPAAVLDRCSPTNAAVAVDPSQPLGSGGQNGAQFTLNVTEGFANSFRSKNLAQAQVLVITKNPAGPVQYPSDLNQNLTGWLYYTETGFFNYGQDPAPAYWAPMSPAPATPMFPQVNGLDQAGKAEAGTRILVKFASIPASAGVFVPTRIMLRDAGSQQVTGTAILVSTDDSGGGTYLPVPGNAAGLAPLAISAGNAQAVYEVVYTDPTRIEVMPIPVALAFTADSPAHSPVSAVITASASLAPYSTLNEASTSAPSPRFSLSSNSTPAFVLQTRTCQGAPPAVATTVTTSPPGRQILIDGTTLTAPGVFQWIPGDQHMIAVPSPQNLTGAQYTFATWSDTGAISHRITVLPYPTTYTAMFQLPRYQLSAVASPNGTGTITARRDSADGFYDAGTLVQLTAVPNTGYQLHSWTGDATGIANPRTISMTGPKSITANFWVPPPPVAAGPYRFVPLPPCRVTDTRKPLGPFGGPSITGGTSRDFVIPNGACGVPGTAKAYALNVTVVPAGPLGYLTVWPAGQSQPNASTLNSLDGRTKANAAVIGGGTTGAISVFASNTTDLVLDITGYFVAPADPLGLAFYPLTPCRIVDTRKPNGSFGAPPLAGGVTRTFPVRSSGCGIPSNAQAYSLNFTAVPNGPLGYLTAGPSGQSLSSVSTLNAHTGAVTANAALVPGGSAGSIDVLASNNTDLVIDINGYFAPPATGGQSLYTEVPCRVIDTRLPSDAPQLSGGVTRDVNMVASVCALPAAAQAYVLNATVVPPGPLGYLTMWPQGTGIPTVSTLNALDSAVTSNMAIVPQGNGSISVFGSNATQLIVDVSGYFGP